MIENLNNKWILTVVLAVALAFQPGPRLAAQTKNLSELPVLTVDASKPAESFKPINGVNGGPRMDLGNYFDNSPYFKRMNPPYVRLHDVSLAAMGAVDIHCIFPDFNADENDPAHYQFGKSDLYIQAILNSGSKVIFRLGEAIEKSKPKFYVNPPTDYKKWARVCCNIIRHYNEGWANGFKWDIRYWEIWNEPNAKNCWTGTTEQYCELYKEASTSIKKLDPSLKVGGPALAGSIASDYGRTFLAYCRDNHLPLDFVSWHGYASHPYRLLENIKKGIAAVDEYGFSEAETIFDEWNYIAGGFHGYASREDARASFLKTKSASGAAFTASMLIYLQNSELDIACYYAAFGGAFRFGLFDIYGVPEKPFYTFEAWNKLVQSGTPVKVTGNKIKTGLGIAATVNQSSMTTAVLLSNFEDDVPKYMLELNHLPFDKNLICTELVIDEKRSMELDREQILSSGDTHIVVNLPKGTVRLLLFTPGPVK